MGRPSRRIQQRSCAGFSPASLFIPFGDGQTETYRGQSYELLGTSASNHADIELALANRCLGGFWNQKAQMQFRVPALKLDPFFLRQFSQKWTGVIFRRVFESSDGVAQRPQPVLRFGWVRRQRVR